MKIRSVKIESFGELKDREYKFGEGFTVIYGKNETGKTTLMEFIRSTVSPSGLKKVYPDYRKSDWGEVVLTEADGTENRLVRDGRGVKSTGRMPTDIVKMEPNVYRSVFAMSVNDLRDSDAINAGEIKSRFLTVPGGETLPRTLDGIKEDMKVLLTPERMSSNTAIGRAMKELKDLDDQIENWAVKESAYSGMVKELNAVNADLAELKIKRERASEAERRISLHKSQADNAEKLKTLKARKEELSPSEAVDDESRKKYSNLDRLLNTASEMAKEASRKEEDAVKKMDGADPAAVLGIKAAIERLNPGAYEELAAKKARLPNESAASKALPVKKKNKAYLAAAVAALAAAAVLGFLYSPIIIAGGVIAAALCIYAYVKSGGVSVAAGEENAAELKETERAMSLMEAELDSVADAAGIRRISFRTDAAALNSLLRNAEAWAGASKDAGEKRMQMKNAEANLNLFLSVYGGKNRYLELEAMRKEYDGVCTGIRTLEEGMKSSGYSDVPPSPPEVSVENLNSLISQKETSAGSKKAEIKALLGDGTADALRDSRTAKEAELFGLVKKWAVLYLAESLAEDACDAAYREIQPEVVNTAGRLVGIMTESRYSLEMGLRTGEITVRQGDSGKTAGEWSTGLRDQIYLSIKLAVAKEMSSPEGLPVILDDVLQMFDSDRKAAACRALGELSKDIQILLFTCDAETMFLAKEEGGAAEMRMM